LQTPKLLRALRTTDAEISKNNVLPRQGATFSRAFKGIAPATKNGPETSEVLCLPSGIIIKYQVKKGQQSPFSRLQNILLDADLLRLPRKMNMFNKQSLNDPCLPTL